MCPTELCGQLQICNSNPQRCPDHCTIESVQRPHLNLYSPTCFHMVFLALFHIFTICLEQKRKIKQDILLIVDCMDSKSLQGTVAHLKKGFCSQSVSASPHCTKLTDEICCLLSPVSWSQYQSSIAMNSVQSLGSHKNQFCGRNSFGLLMPCSFIKRKKEAAANCSPQMKFSITYSNAVACPDFSVVGETNYLLKMQSHPWCKPDLLSILLTDFTLLKKISSATGFQQSNAKLHQKIPLPASGLKPASGPGQQPFWSFPGPLLAFALLMETIAIQPLLYPQIFCVFCMYVHTPSRCISWLHWKETWACCSREVQEPDSSGQLGEQGCGVHHGFYLPHSTDAAQVPHSVFIAALMEELEGMQSWTVWKSLSHGAVFRVAILPRTRLSENILSLTFML